jgi:AcrR family transcriptional regulator
VPIRRSTSRLPPSGAAPLTGVPARPRRAGRTTDVQRTRLLAALFDCIAQDGVDQLTASAIVKRARVSRKTFYEQFSNCEDCKLAALEEIFAHMRNLAVDAFQRERTWREGVRSALGRLLAFLDEEPAVARMCLIEALRGGDALLARRAEMLAQTARALDAVTLAGPSGPRRVVSAQASVGGVLSMLHTRVLQAPGEPLAPLRGQLMSTLVLPYLGARVARRELAIPAAAPVSHPPRPAALSPREALRGVDMRLTYRSVRVLAAIAQRPGSSNLEVANAAGILDQGQISKLLGRLARLELVENHGAGAKHGTANAWRLTPAGATVEQATRQL